MDEYSSARLDLIFSALGDSTRRAIVARLAASEARVTDLAAGFSISLNSVSKHIRALERAGLLRRRILGREHFLSLEPAPLTNAADWIDHHRRFWEDRLDALENYVLRKKKGKRA